MNVTRRKTEVIRFFMVGCAFICYYFELILRGVGNAPIMKTAHVASVVACG